MWVFLNIVCAIIYIYTCFYLFIYNCLPERETHTQTQTLARTHSHAHIHTFTHKFASYFNKRVRPHVRNSRHSKLFTLFVFAVPISLKKKEGKKKLFKLLFAAWKVHHELIRL